MFENGKNTIAGCNQEVGDKKWVNERPKASPPIVELSQQTTLT